MRTWFAESASSYSLGPHLTKEWVIYLFSYGGLFFDLLIVPLLLFRKTRVFGFIGVIMFHSMNEYIYDIGVFPWIMLLATLIFFSPSWPRQLLASVQRKKFHMEQDVPSMPKLSSFYSNSTILFITVFLAFQLLIPFRHHLYPGNVSWTEEGHRYSWRMKLNMKRSHATFLVTDPNSRRTWTFPPKRIMKILTLRQYYKVTKL